MSTTFRFLRWPCVGLSYGTVAIVVAAGLFLLPGVWHAGYVYEDWRFAGTWAAWPTWAVLLRPRGLSWLTFAAVAHLAGDTARAQHLTNLGIHLLNGWLVAQLCTRFSVSKYVIWIGTAIFLLHPLQVEAVSYVSSRPDLLMTGFVLSGALCLTYAATPTVEWCWWTQTRLSVLRWVGVSLCFLLALWSKEIAVAGLGLYLLLRPSGKLLIVCAVPTACVTGLIAWRVAHQGAVLSSSSWWMAATVQATMFWRLMGQVPMPLGQTIDPDPGRVPALLATGALWVLLCMMLGCFIIQGTTVSYTAITVSTGLLWTFIAVVPRFAVPVVETLREHQFYLSMVGVALIGGRLLAPWFSATRSPRHPRGVYAL